MSKHVILYPQTSSIFTKPFTCSCGSPPPAASKLQDVVWSPAVVAMVPVCYLLGRDNKCVAVSVNVLPGSGILPLGRWGICRWSWTDDLHAEQSWCPHGDRDADLRWKKIKKSTERTLNRRLLQLCDWRTYDERQWPFFLCTDCLACCSQSTFNNRWWSGAAWGKAQLRCRVGPQICVHQTHSCSIYIFTFWFWGSRKSWGWLRMSSGHLSFVSVLHSKVNFDTCIEMVFWSYCHSVQQQLLLLTAIFVFSDIWLQ